VRFNLWLEQKALYNNKYTPNEGTSIVANERIVHERKYDKMQNL